jgi:hypothetical protein
MRRLALLSAFGLFVSACAADDSSDGGGGTDGDDGGSATDDGDDDGGTDDGDGSGGDGSGDDGGTGDGTGDSGSGGDTGDTGDDGGDGGPPPATGITIVDVTMDQGTRTPIAIGGQLVGGQQRERAILQGRPSVLRAFYEVDAGFEGRNIYALLTLHLPGGTTVEHESFEGAYEQDCGSEPLYECRYGNLSMGFYWHLPAEEVVPGVEYEIDLFETSPGHEDDVSDKDPHFPNAGGTMPIGVEDSYMKMRAMLVPIYHDLGPDCREAPDFSEIVSTDFWGQPQSIEGVFNERLFVFNPVDEVETVVHDVVNYSGDATGSSGLLNLMQQLRIQDGAEPGWYYYGVIRPCDGGPDFSGVSLLGGPNTWEADQRVSWGVWYSGGGGAGTFVHELGHQQGRAHVACNGEEAGPNPSYPDHPEGDLVSYGINVLSNPIDVHPPTDHDYMTYCPNQWVSAWGWDRVFPWIEEISSWEQGAPLPPPQDLLFGLIRPDDSAEWFVGKSWFDAAEASTQHIVRFYDGADLVFETPAVYQRYEKSDDFNLIAPVPPGFDRVSAVTWLAAGEQHEVDLATVKHVRRQVR